MFKNLQLTPNQPKFCPAAQVNIYPHNQIPKSPNWGGNGREHSQSLQTLL